MSQIQIDECKAELLYVKRCIDTTANFYDSNDSLKQIEALQMSTEDYRRNLLVCKYYVKSLLRHDEYQLGVETKDGYQ